MIQTVSWLLTLTLAAIAALHLYWAFGGLWPAGSEAGLVRTVVGDPVGTRMPPVWMTVVVAILLAGIAAWPLVLSRYAELVGGTWLAVAGSVVLAVIFLLRGLAGYLPSWRRRHPADPFARLDRTLYAPLCLAIGAGFLFGGFMKGLI